MHVAGEINAKSNQEREREREREKEREREREREREHNGQVTRQGRRSKCICNKYATDIHR